MPVDIHHAAAREIDPLTLYAILRLRVDVFVVEQACPYPDLDGRDVEAGTELFWAADGPQVLATLRLLHDAGGSLRIGRVATAPAVRSRGLAAQLMRAALHRCAELDPSAPVVLDAQSHLAHWYACFDFRVAGPEFDEDGIPHVPMHRAPYPPPRRAVDLA